MSENNENKTAAAEVVAQGEEPANKATFIVQIQYRQNATWQGQIHWKEKDEERMFRSELELIKLIDSAAENDTM